MAGSPHIAYLFSRYPVVSQTFCDSEMLALEALGVRLSVASLNPPTTSFRHQRLDQLKAEIHYPPPSAVLKEIEIPPAMQALADEHAKKHPRFKIERARNAAYFARLFARIGIDHVHVHFANQATWTALFLKKAGFPFSFTAHAQDFMVDLGSNDLLREMAAEAEFVIAVSDYSRKLMCDLCPDSAAKIHRVYNGIDIEAFSAGDRGRSGRAAFSQQNAPVRLISIGRLIEFKGFHHLIEAVDLLGNRGLGCELQIIGEGPWRERLENQIAGLGVEGRVRLRGVLDNEQVRTELASSDVFALACCVDDKGATDVLPTVIAEAMAAGLPVVSTRIAGVPEMVEHEKTGLLVEPARPDQLADALAKLAGDAEWRAQLGVSGRVKCEQTFSLVKTAAAVKDLFERNAASRADDPASQNPEVLILWNGHSPAQLVKWLLLNNQQYPMISAGWPEFGPWHRVYRTACPERVEFLPHSIVLESLWDANPSARKKVEEMSQEFAGLLSERFFREARRAVYVMELMRKRTIRHVHAWNDTTMLWAWLVKQLTGCTASFAAEHVRLEPPSLFLQLAPDFDFGNVGDAAMRRKLDGRFNDELGLEKQASDGFKIGPVHIGCWFMWVSPFFIGRRKRSPPDPDVRGWVERNLNRNLNRLPNPNPLAGQVDGSPSQPESDGTPPIP